MRGVFETCLFGPPAPEELRFGGRGFASPSLDALQGSWVAQDGVDARLHVRGLFGLRVRFTCDGETFVQEDLYVHDRRYSVGLRDRANGVAGELLLWLDGDDEDQRLLGVFVRRDRTSAVPRRIDFSRAR